MLKSHRPDDLSPYQKANTAFAHLSLRDLVIARDQHHEFLMKHAGVVATAIGRYRIRKTDSWPNDKKKIHGTGVRRLDNSEVRPYSWPCILVFVDDWKSVSDFAHAAGQLLPPFLDVTDGPDVPICVVEAPKEITTEVAARDIRYPLNNIGPGNPIIAQVQGREYAATVGCLVSDGHRVYALTNRHVTGDPGEVVWAVIDGHPARVGVSSAKQLTRRPFSEIYPNLPGRDTFVNLDIGLIDLDDLSRWTTDIGEFGAMGPMAEFSGTGISLSLIGCQVCAEGAASGVMRGEILALFYRYKTSGGFEYVADLFIGPRSGPPRSKASESSTPATFATLPGDSGSLWLLDPTGNEDGAQPGSAKSTAAAPEFLPLALEWGRNMLYSADKARPQSFALATLLSRVCALLEVDPVRAWNVGQDDTWGSVGHFAIAARTQVALSGRYPKLSTLMKNNALIISHSEDDLLSGDFSGMGSADFVPMADVPDFFWKPRIAKQGHARALEGPNHFADMDQEGPGGKTLLDLTKDDAFIDPAKWQAFYDSVTDILSGDPIAAVHRGLLPFRVWQLFNAMVEFAKNGAADKFVCAAGVLTHYVGDACQPLHISYLHDGDPKRPVDHTFSKGKKQGQTESRPMGQGVHSAYEDAMVSAYRGDILEGLLKTPKATKGEEIAAGRDAAKRTIELMRNTFTKIPPTDLVQAYIDVGVGGKECSDALWKDFGKATIAVMQGGAHLLAVLWESAWALGDGESNIKSTKALTQQAAMDIVADPEFAPSVSVDQISPYL